MTSVGVVSTEGRRLGPKFRRPPVNEVAIGVEFAPLNQLGSVALVRLHDHLRDLYPEVQEQPPLPPQPALPGTLVGGPPTISFGAFGGTVPLRLWMLALGGDVLVQAQNDRIVLNWRRDPSGSVYPSYDRLKERFVEIFARFGNFCAQHDFVPVPLTVEVTSVNSISNLSQPSQLLREAPSDTEGLLQYGIQRVTFAGYEGEAGGCSANSLFQRDNITASFNSTLVISTRVGVAKDDRSWDALSHRLDHAHDVGVDVFVSLTSEEMHRRWERYQ